MGFRKIVDKLSVNVWNILPLPLINNLLTILLVPHKLDPYFKTSGLVFQDTAPDQNRGGALFRFSVRTATNRTSYILSAVSVCHIFQTFNTISSEDTMIHYLSLLISTE